ncbi:MAG: sugar phosphate isomerase/epimerase family protein, partial [Limisphaerales bacterium]
MNRRTFLGTMTAATMFADRLARAASDDRKLEHIAVQLYTVRGPMKKDFEGTLAKVASIGYREVEFAG